MIWFLALLLGCSTIQAPAASLGAEPIDRTQYLSVGDARLYLRIRGEAGCAPVLIWLHGGPGAAETPLFRLFNSALEDDFVVAYWDQRGAGRSFDPEADTRRLTVAQHLDDLDAVVDELRRSLGRDKVILAGHSWGSALGLLYAQAHPDKVAAFVGVGQLTSEIARQRAQYEFVSAEAERRDDEAAAAEVREIGPPPYTAPQELAIQGLVDRYGGYFHRRPSFAWAMLRGMLAGYAAPWEIPKFLRANDVSLDAMNAELLQLDLPASVPGVEVPVLFFLGRYDHQVDAALAAAYFESLKAPAKKLVWFEESAHNPPFEEPEAFNQALVVTLTEVGAFDGRCR